MTEDHTLYASFEKKPLPKYDVIYGGYSFGWKDSSQTPSQGTGGGGPVITEKIEEGQVFEYTYPGYVKDEQLPIANQFEIPFQYVLINGVKYYDRHVSITITGNTTITAYYYIDKDI